MVYLPLVKATEILRLKLVLKHSDGVRLAIFEVVAWQVPQSPAYPEGIRYRIWFTESGETIFGFDNHSPKGHHLHLGSVQIAYDFQGLDRLKQDAIRMIQREGFIHEN